jgi:hypothetical protein
VALVLSAVGIVVGVGFAALVWPGMGPGPSRVLIACEPAGGEIWIDGRPTVITAGTEGTPIDALPAGTHEVLVRRLGWEDARVELVLDPRDRARWRGQRLSLVLQRPVPRLPEPDAGPSLAAPDAGLASDTGIEALPPGVLAAVDSKKDVLVLPGSPAVKRTLVPGHSYRFSVHGEALMGGMKFFLKQKSVWFFARGPGLARTGWIGPKPGAMSTLTGASAIWLFIVDTVLVDNKGGIGVTIEDTAGGPPQKVFVDARKNCLSVGSSELFLLPIRPSMKNLRVDCKVSLGRGGAPAVGYFNEADLGWFINGPDGDKIFGAVGPDHLVEVARGVSGIRMFFLDDDPRDNSGRCEVRLAEE